MQITRHFSTLELCSCNMRSKYSCKPLGIARIKESYLKSFSAFSKSYDGYIC